MSTVSAVVLWRAFILLHVALHCYLFFPGFVRGKQNSRQRLLELTHPREQFRDWILKQMSYAAHHLPEAVGFSVEVTVLLPAQISSPGTNVVLVAGEFEDGLPVCLHSEIKNRLKTSFMSTDHWLCWHRPTTHSHSESFQLAFPSLILSAMASTYIINYVYTCLASSTGFHMSTAKFGGSFPRNFCSEYFPHPHNTDQTGFVSCWPRTPIWPSTAQLVPAWLTK